MLRSYKTSCFSHPGSHRRIPSLYKTSNWHNYIFFSNKKHSTSLVSLFAVIVLMIFSASTGLSLGFPVPGIKQTYGLESIHIDDSDVIVYAIYRNDPQKENLIREYINTCRSLFRFS